MAVIYLDSGVLIAASRPTSQGHSSALELLASDAEFVSSDMVRLEIWPKAVYHRHRTEQEFYEAYFRATVGWARLDEQLGVDALAVGEQFGLAAVDALHIAAALKLGADEFVTVERPSSRLLAVTLLPVRTLTC